jgi:O-antigen/teichoic acid export membrane protein
VVLPLVLALPGAAARWLPAYLDGVAAAQLLLLGVVAIGVASGVANFLNTVGRHQLYLAIQAGAIAANALAATAATAAGFGIEGVSAASSLTLVAYAGVLAWVMARSVRSPLAAQPLSSGLR